MAGSLKQLWSGFRMAVKSIYNGICSYIKGEIKDFRTLVKTILKSVFSAAFVVTGGSYKKATGLAPTGLAVTDTGQDLTCPVWLYSM